MISVTEFFRGVLNQLCVIVFKPKGYPSSYVWGAWVSHVDVNGKTVYDQKKTLLAFIRKFIKQS